MSMRGHVTLEVLTSAVDCRLAYDPGSQQSKHTQFNAGHHTYLSAVWQDLERTLEQMLAVRCK